MKRDLALKLLTQIVKECDGFTEVKLTESEDVLHPNATNEYDILIEEYRIYPHQLESLQKVLASQKNVDLVIELRDMQIRIFEIEEEV